MGKRILIPYLRAGLGHLVQAQAIAGFLRGMRPEWDVRLMDAARDLDDALLQRTFVELWRVLLRMPGPVSRAVFSIERLAPGLTRRLNRRSFRTAVPKAAAYLALHPVDLIMSTHWACSHLFAMARTDRAVPIYYVYGELDTAYNLADCGADLYFALSANAAEGLARLGIDPAIIRTVPVVVDPSMVESRVPREVTRRSLGIPKEHFVVVLSLGGEGIGRTIPFIEAFARDVRGATLVALTGRNTELLQKLRRRVHSPAVVALGYQEDLSPIVAAADALAGKCGTGFAAMAIATGVPLIVTHLGAPNEWGNMRFIVDNGHGWHCPRPREFTGKVMELVRARAACPEAAGARRRPAAQNGAELIAAAIVDALS